MKKIILFIFLILFAISQNASFAEENNSENKVFTLKQPILRYDNNWEYCYSTKLNKTSFIITRRKDSPPIFKLFLYDTKANKITPLEDKLLNKQDCLEYFIDNKLIVYSRENKADKFGLYDYKTKKLKYFKGISWDENPKASVKLNDKEIIFHSENNSKPARYKLCNADTMTCKFVQKNSVEPRGILEEQIIDENKILEMGRGEGFFGFYLYDIKTDTQKRLNDIKNDSNSFFIPIVYKKNHIAILSQNRKKGTKISLYELKGDEFIEIGTYKCPFIPKKITDSSLINLDENTFLLLGGGEFFLEKRTVYTKNAYIFDVETKTYTQIESLPAIAYIDWIIKMADDKWLIRTTKGNVIEFNKKGLDN